MSQPRNIGLAHGAGGLLTDRLVRDIFLRHLGNPLLDRLGDSALLPGALLGAAAAPPGLAFTTDGFVVSPRRFPGGDLGSLAVNGTVNDLAVAGALPRFLSLSVILEEGLALEELDELVCSLARAAREAGVQVVTGDTKVVGRGAGDGAFFVTAGIGPLRPGVPELLPTPQPGDGILVSGPVGDHGATILALRSAIDPGPGLRSDCAAVTPLVDALFAQGIYPAFLRDPTRGGLSSTLSELAGSSGMTLRLQEEALPVRREVEAVSDLLGVDCLHLACEGRVVAVVPAAQVQAALAAWHGLPAGAGAALIGWIDRQEGGAARVLLQTRMGGLRVVDRPAAQPLPRIC
ncbi:MAG: hydrogenase expression/formation protein HypE [Deltaproteobacteria bacterium]|nr:hydrogenase expression/formation protein HypE [Deltaproteobacteria bacterium]